ncbi:MAG: TonB-dependent receptor, partial [candidate division Zixibacteria bacterium]|nr:TonB-dependent receptor [candidate division Zixibacteria bacterium]
PFKIYYGIGWQERNAGSVWLEIAGRLVNRQDRVPEGFPRTNSFSVFDLKSGFSFNHAVSFSLIIKNLTGKTYVEPVNQFNLSNPVIEPGRSVIIGFTIDTH